MKHLMVLLGSPYCFFPLAQEVTAFPFCVYGDDHDHRGHCNDQKDFHAPRIAPSCKFVLCSEFANAKQLCKSDFRTFVSRILFTSC